MPLRHRLRLRALSTRFCNIIEDGLQKTSSLYLCDKKAYSPAHKADHLLIKSSSLTEVILQLLVRLFPSLTKLTVSLWQAASWSLMPALLTQLATNCTTLKLYGYDAGETIAKQPIADALNALLGVTSLTWVLRTCRQLPYIGPLLSRLEKFSCPSAPQYHNHFIASSLSPRCTHLLLSDWAFLRQHSSVTHLYLMDFNANDWQSFDQLHGVSSLTLDFSDWVSSVYVAFFLSSLPLD